MVEIVVSAFDSSVTPVSVLSAFNSADAVAEYQVNVAEFWNLFGIQCPDNLLDDTANSVSPSTLGTTTSNIKYYVDTSNTTFNYSFFSAVAAKKINPAFALVTLNSATTTNSAGDLLGTDNGMMGVVNDYMRDLARQELGSAFLTNVFTNEVSVQQSLITGGDVEVGKIVTLLESLNGSSARTDLAGESPNKYAPDTFEGQSNVCKVLFQGLFAQAPERFSALNFTAKHPLPFAAGDSIVFNFTCDNSAQQVGKTDGWAAPLSVKDRRYKIRLVMKSLLTAAVNPGADALAAIWL